GAPDSLRGQLATPKSLWPSRMLEVVADIYGALAVGLPFLVVLEDLLRPWLKAEADKVPPAQGYPPARLRLRMAGRAVLAQESGVALNDLPPAAQQALAAIDQEAQQADVIADGVLETKVPALKNTTLVEVFDCPPFLEMEKRHLL